MPDSHPTTIHASGVSFITEEDETSDGDMTPRASATSVDMSSAPVSARRMSREDTAADLHMLAEPQDIMSEDPKPSLAPVPSTDQLSPMSEDQIFTHLHSTRRSRRPLSRFPSQTDLTASKASDRNTVAQNKTASLGRRFSRNYKERMHDLRESMQRYAIPVVTNRTRRSSTPHRTPLSENPETYLVDPAQLSRTPTSPSKRSAKQGDDRPRKLRPTFFPLSDRKDTPAPTAFGLPVRPASSRTAPPIISASGGDGARKAAALYNNQPGHIQFNAVHWGLSEDDDIHTRRRRLGSLSSAADSGADLSTYSGSDSSIRDQDGDVDMSTAGGSISQPSRDFVRSLPYEISLQIFEYLDAHDLTRTERVNRTWYGLAQETSVWRTIFLRKYQRRILTDPPPIQVGGVGCGRPNRPNQEWRKMYKARVQLEQNWRAGAADAGKAIYLSGHTDSVYCLQFDEDKIITGSRDRTIRVWDINTFQCLRVIGGPNVKPVLGPKVLRTVDYPSFHLATASVNGTAYGDGIYHVPFEWHDASILCLQYDDKILVTGSSDSDLLVWDIKTYEPVKRLKKHTGGVLDVALDEKHIVSCSKDSRIIVWDRATLEAKGDLTGHRGPVNAVQLRGHLLVSASGDGIARLWDLNQMKLIKEFSAKERGLAAVEFSEDMKYVLAGGNDNITYKFETETGREVMQFTGHSQLVRSLWLDSANNRVVSGSYDLDLRVYDFVTGQEIWRGEEWTTSWMLAAKSDYRRIVATSQDGRILIVDFGILKGAPTYKSRDGSPIENVDLLRGTDNTNVIQFRNPFESTRDRAVF